MKNLKSDFQAFGHSRNLSEKAATVGMYGRKLVACFPFCFTIQNSAALPGIQGVPQSLCNGSISLLGAIQRYYAPFQLPEGGNVIEVPKRSLCTVIPMKDCITLILILVHFPSVKAKDVFL